MDGFEIKQEDEAEETSLNHFQRCELKITDDSGNTFTTKNPFIINEVAGNIKSLCLGKLAEVEGRYSDDESKFKSILSGTGLARTQTAFNLCTDFVKVGTTALN